MALVRPVFDHRDSNLPDFWNERFERQFTPWDQSSVPAELRRFIAQTGAPLSTLIPGCGADHAVAHLAASGWPVVAIDFSASAVAAARSALGAYADRVVQADFFAFEPSVPIHFIYERAFLCALPRSRWSDVVARWAQLLPAGGLLGGFFFFDDKAGGPPFGADRQQLAHLMQPYFVLLEDQPADVSIPLFAGRERWQVWRRHEDAMPRQVDGE